MGEKIIDPELRKFFDSLKVKDAKPVTKPSEPKEKTLHKDEPVKVPKKKAEIAHRMFAMQAEVRKSPRFPRSEQKEMPNLQTGRIWNKTDARKDIIGHCRDMEEINAAEYAWLHPYKLILTAFSPLGEGKDPNNPKDKKNLEHKIKDRHFTGFNVYEITDESETTWQVKMAIVKGKHEQFYQHNEKEGVETVSLAI